MVAISECNIDISKEDFSRVLDQTYLEVMDDTLITISHMQPHMIKNMHKICKNDGQVSDPQI